MNSANILVYSVHEDQHANVTILENMHYCLATMGGKPGQGYPCVLTVEREYDEK